MRWFVLIFSMIFLGALPAKAERLDRAIIADAGSNGSAQERAVESDRLYDSHLYHRGDRYRTSFGVKAWRDRGRCNWCTLRDWHRAALRSGYSRHSAYEGAADWHPTYREAPRLTSVAAANSDHR